MVETVANASRDVGVMHLAIEEAPVEWDERFHFVYSRHVMEHCVDPALTVSMVKHVLAPNGVVGHVHYATAAAAEWIAAAAWFLQRPRLFTVSSASLCSIV